uniref:Tudor domain-containing protein n=1 Tax=Attheya septentrionalis TaxID=420275 RepID=A0A7S2UMU6_9STRA|mmetsp:Transcript_5221/g.9170  ORF Transcript_5221/g.9170 Transcript_5221/m.9170 type:complete len:342 (+) Transcript_5221:166-1191(+)|eukprot:CAMPEP_0198296062 /NCGR_PEP_ID=MMETSP1449-20131203/30769_1 /TAXON_ID=420275 /ORGANISM="Attheya septentrionalis, Strain CCMP2084" /LENGTH=341 /DNA_ID=CAMNT_0043996551 /DNA_START=74 /DNA_END=1099 /DNA_ORIENTATION=+
MHSVVESTTDGKSERHLGAFLGYPKGWHVVRRRVTGVLPSTSKTFQSFVDRIYAGDPQKGFDCYYNHSAAYEAGLKWVPGESTGYDTKGGQMLARKAAYSKGDEVEAYYEPEDKWYTAQITKVKPYDDDIRYCILYTEENTTDNNVTEDEIRKPVPKMKKKPGRKRKNEEVDANENELELAAEFGLPEGWIAVAQSNSKFSIQSPCRKQKFRSKKAAFEFLGMKAPSSRKKQPKQEAEVEEGDPPWRTTGHELLGQKVRVQNATETGDVVQIGTVKWWISKTDVDKEGEAGFLSESTGKPASLFHVIFDESDPTQDAKYKDFLLEFQDMEEYEVRECLIEE